MSFSNDLDQIHKSGDPHSDAATIDGSTVYGEFNQPASDASDVSGLGAVFVGTSADISTVSKADSVTILGTTYEVVEVTPSSGGEFITLTLNESEAEETVAVTEYEEVTSARLTIEVGDKLYDLESDMDSHPFTASIEVEPAKQYLDYRLTNKTWDDTWLSSGLSYAPAIVPVTASGVTLEHDEGVDEDTLASEIDDCIADLEDKVTGLTVKTWAYPQHRHDRYTLWALRDRGIIHARNGSLGTAPTGSHLLGTDSSASVILENWDSWCPWEATVPDGLYSSDLRGLSSADMTAWLYDTAQYIIDNSTPPADQPELFGYSSLMDAWKAKNTWIHVYFHNTTEMPVADLETLIDILQADSEIWLERCGTIAEFAHARHEPEGATHSDPLIYEPIYSGGGTAPWNGHKMAATISLDDPQATGVDDLIPAAIAKSCPVNVYVANVNIEENGGGAVSVAELQSFHDSGYVEIGGHSYNHYLQIENLACKLRDTDRATCKKAVSVYNDSPNLQMRFYRDSAVAFPLTLGRSLTRWWDATNLDMDDGASVTSWTDRKSGDIAANVNSAALYSAEYQNGLGCVQFRDAVHAPLIGGPGDIHSNTNGLMVFIAADYTGSTYRKMLAKWSGASGGYFWHFGQAWLQMCSSKTNSRGSVYFSDVATWWPVSTFGIYCVAWTPGTPPRVYFNGELVAEPSWNLSGIEMDSGANAAISIGGDAASGGIFNGRIGEIITVAQDDATIRQEIESYLMASTRWGVS